MHPTSAGVTALSPNEPEEVDGSDALVTLLDVGQATRVLMKVHAHRAREFENEGEGKWKFDGSEWHCV
jgi:hypothetical protein